MLAAQPKAFFTIPHFDGYPAVLIQMKAVTKRPLREAIVDGWLAMAPRKLADEYMEQQTRSAVADAVPSGKRLRNGTPALEIATNWRVLCRAAYRGVLAPAPRRRRPSPAPSRWRRHSAFP